MMLRTKDEQKAYLDGYEMCAECIKNYLTDEGKQKLECLLMTVRNAVGIETLEQEPKTDVLDKIRTEIEKMPSELTADGRRMIRRESVFRIIDKYKAESEAAEL